MRSPAEPRWLESQPESLHQTQCDSKVFTDELPHVTLVADPFHIVKLATSKLDEVRRRVEVAQKK